MKTIIPLILILIIFSFVGCQPSIVNLQEVELVGPSIKYPIKIVEKIDSQKIDFNFNFAVNNKRKFETNLSGHTKINEYNFYELNPVENENYFLEYKNINIFEYEGKNLKWKIPSFTGSLNMDFKFSQNFAVTFGTEISQYDDDNFFGFNFGLAYFHNFEELGIRFDAFGKNHEAEYSVQYVKADDYEGNTRKVYVYNEEGTDNYYNMGYLVSANTNLENWPINFFANYGFGWQTFYEISPSGNYNDEVIGDFEMEQYYTTFSIGLVQNSFSFGRVLLGYSITNYNRGDKNFLLPNAFLQIDLNLF